MHHLPHCKKSNELLPPNNHGYLYNHEELLHKCECPNVIDEEKIWVCTGQTAALRGHIYTNAKTSCEAMYSVGLMNNHKTLPTFTNVACIGCLLTSFSQCNTCLYNGS